MNKICNYYIYKKMWIGTTMRKSSIYFIMLQNH